MESENKKINYRTRFYFWAIVDKILAFLPVIIYGIVRWEHYFGITTKSTFSNIVGFVLIIAMLLILLIKKTQALSGLTVLVIVEAILICLDVYVKDMKFILGFAIIGLILSTLITQPFVNKYYKLVDKNETATINANQFKEVIKELKESIVEEESARG